MSGCCNWICRSGRLLRPLGSTLQPFPGTRQREQSPPCWTSLLLTAGETIRGYSVGKAWGKRRGLKHPRMDFIAVQAGWLKETKISHAGVFWTFCIFLSHYIEVLST